MSMRDLPCIALAATVWAYWGCVGAMIVRVRRRTRKLSGLVPAQRVEQFGPPRGLPDYARDAPVAALRWVAVTVARACLALSIDCWLRMGRNWRMAVTPDQQTDLVTTGLYGHVRHPIYALSILLMLCTVAVAPTVPIAVMAVTHVVLMVVKPS